MMSKLMGLTFAGCLLLTGSLARADIWNCTAGVDAPTPGSTQYNPVCEQAHCVWTISGPAHATYTVDYSGRVQIDGTGPSYGSYSFNIPVDLGASGYWDATDFNITRNCTLSGATHTVKATAQLDNHATGTGPPNGVDGPYTFFLD
jgi:hypothetical protein